MFVRLLTISLFSSLISSLAAASCLPMFDQEMRKLHSKALVNLCDLTASKTVLVVNTASHCGFTPQFRELEALHQRFADQGLVVLGFPSNDFRQESKEESETAEICYRNYGVSFTMLAPGSVLGAQANPVFSALGAASKAPSWNFNKYLVNSDGNVTHYSSTVKPLSEQLVGAIERALAPVDAP